MKLIDKDKVVSEIEKRKSELQSIIAELGTFESNTLGLFQDMDLYDDILSLLDTLEVKDVDLDYIKDEVYKVVKNYKPSGDFGWGTLYNVATHFFELGIKAQKVE